MAKKKENKSEESTPETPDLGDMQDVGDVEVDTFITDPKKRLRLIASSLAVVVIATLSIAALVHDDEPVTAVGSDIPTSPPMTPTNLKVEVQTPSVKILQPLPEEVAVSAIGDGFECAFLIGSWSDVVTMEAERRKCDIVVMEYIGETVFYYDVAFDTIHDITHSINQ